MCVSRGEGGRGRGAGCCWLKGAPSCYSIQFVFVSRIRCQLFGMPVDARTRVRTTFSSGKGKRQEEDRGPRVEHPLQKHSPKTPSFSSSFDGTLTRPNLRRQVRGGSFHESTLAEESRPEHHVRSHSDSGYDDWADTPGASTSASTTSELPPTLEDTREVVVHQVNTVPVPRHYTAKAQLPRLGAGNGLSGRRCTQIRGQGTFR